MTKFILLVFSILMLGFVLPSRKKIKIFLAGDSTVSNKEKKAFPETGWGMPFTYFWDSSITVVNRAKNGRSTKSFISEGLWQSILDEASYGDYIFIQFGHNDESKDKGDRYSTAVEFKANLLKFVLDSRKKHAIPILITPVARRKFDANEVIKETHGEYPDLVKQVASENDVPLIDLNEKSKILLNELGPESSKNFFNYLSIDENPNYPNGAKDDTHFNELGARRMAELVLQEIKFLNLDLVERIVAPGNKK